jgi:hypothetical protein
VTEIRAALDLAACTVILGASREGYWSFRTGPDLVADESIAAGTALMTWSVADIEAAAEALAGLGARRAGDVFTIDALGGLEIGLTDASPIRPPSLADRRGES